MNSWLRIRQDDGSGDDMEECDPDAPTGGCARGAGPTSLAGLLSTMIPALALAVIYFVAFLFLRKNKKRFYAPRTYLGTLRPNQRTPSLPSGLANWFGAYWKIPDTHALTHQSLDSYLFLRYLRISCAICLGGMALTWPILFPVNATGGRNLDQLERVSYSNIDIENPVQKRKLYAHAIVAWLYYGFVLYMIMRELIFYINLRQAVMLSPMHATRMSNRTVLFTQVSKPYLNETRLRIVYGDGVKRVWVAGNSQAVDEAVGERNKVAMRLEAAEVSLITSANKVRQKAIAKGASDEKAMAQLDVESGSLAARWIPDKKRPTHKTGFLGLFGEKVDSINWCREKLATLIPNADNAQNAYRGGEYKRNGAVFVEFHTQSEAQVAYQVLAHHHALHMAPRYIGVKPHEVVWSSLNVSWWQRIVRRHVILAAITTMILFFAIPVAFIGAISNIKQLANDVSWLGWLNDIPLPIMGVISGLLPSLLIAVLLALVPIVLRLCAKLCGEPTLARVELFTQNAYFAFLVIQVFLITTFSSGAAAVAKKIIDNPSSAPALLAENLPTASNFYVSYFLVQGFTIGMGALAQVAGYAIFTLMYKFLANTPRNMYEQWTTLVSIGWGNTLPMYSLITVIAITYAGIAPLVSGFAFIAILLFYLAYRYNILFMTEEPIDTHGLIYPRALKHLLVGVYLAELCMLGLFAASKALGPFVLMVILVVITVLFTLTLFNSLNPLLYNLPQSLLTLEEPGRASTSLVNAMAPVSPADERPTDPFRRATTTNSKAEPAAMTIEDIHRPEKKGNFITRWFKPWRHADYATLRKMMPSRSVDIDNRYPEYLAKDAYFPPSLKDKTPLLWIPEDSAGISKQEIAHTNRVIPITDVGCTLDDKGNMIWDSEGARPPIWEEKLDY